MINLSRDMFVPLGDSVPEDGEECLVLFRGTRPLSGNESCYSLHSLQWDEEYQSFCFNNGMSLWLREDREIIGWVKNDVLLM